MVILSKLKRARTELDRASHEGMMSFLSLSRANTAFVNDSRRAAAQDDAERAANEFADARARKKVWIALVLVVSRPPCLVLVVPRADATLSG